MYFSYPQITWWLNGNSILSFFMFLYSTKRTTYDLIFFLSLSTNRRHELIPLEIFKEPYQEQQLVLFAVLKIGKFQPMKSYWWFNWPHSKGGVVMKCVLLDADVVFLAVTPDLLKWDILLIYRSNMTYETSFRTQILALNKLAMAFQFTHFR